MSAKTKSIIKYTIALALLGLVLFGTDTKEISSYFKKISLQNLFFAFSFVVIAHIIAAFRMRFFFIKSGFLLTHNFSIILYFVGAFYNFLLPGGLGGDAYKVIIAKKRMEMPTKTGIAIMVADRASGLYALIVIMIIALYMIDLSNHIPFYYILLPTGFVITSFAYLYAAKILLKQKMQNMILSLPYSFAIQLLWIFTIYELWLSLAVQGSGEFVYYTILYCAASIAALLPITVGGLGVREITYSEGAKLFSHYQNIHIDSELGVALSLCVFALSLIVALPGLLWLNKVSKKDFSGN